MTIGIRRTADPTAIRTENTKSLGEYGGFDYLVDGRVEYELGQTRAESPDAFSVGPDDRLFSEPRLFRENGNEYEVGRWFRVGRRVASGKYQALVERDNAARAANAKANPLVVVDALDTFVSLFGPRSDMGIQMPPTSRAWASVLVEGDPPADDDPIRRGYVPGRPAARGHDAIVERIAETGVVLVTSRTGAVTYLTRGGDLLEPDRLAITRAMPVVLRKPCAFDHGKDEAPEAWTVAEPSYDPICKPHVFGELRL